jgi:hypothetical protein
VRSPVSLSIGQYSTVQSVHNTEDRTELKKSFPFKSIFSILWNSLPLAASCQLPASPGQASVCIVANPPAPLQLPRPLPLHFHNPQSTIHLHFHDPPSAGSFTPSRLPSRDPILLVLPRPATVVPTVMTQHRQGSGKVSISKDATR